MQASCPGSRDDGRREIVGALESAVVVGGLDALSAGLYSIGIPKDSILKFETALKTAHFLLIAHGSPAEATTAQQILRTTPVAGLGVHVDEPMAVAGKEGKAQAGEISP